MAEAAEGRLRENRVWGGWKQRRPLLSPQAEGGVTPGLEGEDCQGIRCSGGEGAPSAAVMVEPEVGTGWPQLLAGSSPGMCRETACAQHCHLSPLPTAPSLAGTSVPRVLTGLTPFRAAIRAKTSLAGASKNPVVGRRPPLVS